MDNFVSVCMGEDDLDEAHWSCDEDMKPESWEEMLESRIGACWGSAELHMLDFLDMVVLGDDGGV